MRAAPPPKVWLLFGRGAGGNGQMQSLAEALGWPYEIKQLHHNLMHVVPNLLLGASKISVDEKKSSALAPPWPDLVIAASRRSAPVAQWIRAQSGGRTKLVHLLHAQAPLDWFDLVVTMPQFRLPERENVLHVTGVLNRIDPAELEKAAADCRSRFEHLPRPWTALLVGGNSSAYCLDAATAARLAREAQAQAESRGGSLLVTTSPRTPPEAADAIASALTHPFYFHRWRKGDGNSNPYKGLLALADDFVVTIDSASLLVEASATGKPVAVFEWPRRKDSALLEAPGWLGRKAVELGLVKPARDFDAYFSEMRARGLAHRLGEPLPKSRQPLDDLERSVDRVRELFDLPPLHRK